MSHEEDTLFADKPDALGRSLHSTSQIIDAIKIRFAMIRDKIPKKSTEDHEYVGYRTSPDSVARRCVAVPSSPGLANLREFETADLVCAIYSGAIDPQIVDTYHERAAAEYYYRHEKRWD